MQVEVVDMEAAEAEAMEVEVTEAVGVPMNVCSICSNCCSN